MYINDAFSVSHRSHASVSAITKYIPSYAGPLLQQEIKNLNKVSHESSLVVILGGVKISSKLPLIKKLLPRASAIIMGGGLANTLLKVRGKNIGASLYDANSLTAAKRLTSKKIMLPIDVVVQNGKKITIKSISQVQTKEKILDLGPMTLLKYDAVIAKAKNIIWNGPIGLFENKNFQKGTKQIIQSIQKAHRKKSFSLAGGGETVEAIRRLKAEDSFSWVSTGGGASLTFLSGEPMPGLKNLID
jgi:phosphoglycerate kinase